MNRIWKNIAFGVLVIACVAAAALLFMPVQQTPVPATPGMEEITPQPTPPPAVAPVEPVEAPRPEAVEEASAAEWNIYHGGNALRGVAEALTPDELAVQWTVLTGGPVRQPPVVHGGAVFAATSRGVVFSLAGDGRELWRRDLNDPEPGSEVRGDIRIEAPVTAFAGRVFVGTDMGGVFALQADTGAPLWHADIEGPVRGAISYSDDGRRVFVLDQDEGALVCLDADSGEQVWRSTGVDRSDGSPAISGDIAVFGSCASAMHIVSTGTGERVRDITIENGGGQIAGGVALADGFAYTGVRDGRILGADIEAGVFLWTTLISEDEVFATPAVREGWVIATSYDGRVHALDRETGEIRWQQDLDGMPSSPIIAGDQVLVAADGVLFVLRLEDGVRVREYPIADEITGPAIASGMIFVGSEDGAIIALGAAS